MRKLLLTLTLLFFAKGLVQAQKDYNYPLKAAYIYHFTKFIDWKSVEDTTQVFIIGVLGKSDPDCEDRNECGIYPYLVDIQNRHTIKSKVIIIEEIVFADQINAVTEINFCDILFVPKHNAKYLDRLLELVDENTLLIGESPNFASNGGAINFVEYDNTLRFELNKNSILRNGFKVSNQLLKLAILIDEEGG